MPCIANKVAQLESDIARRLADLQSEEVKPSHVIGFASTSVNAFEVLLREAIAFYADTCGIKLDQNPGSCTLGQLIEWLQQHNQQLTSCARKSSAGLERLANRRLVSPADIECLNGITKLRNKLHHHVDDFAMDDVTRRRNTKDLLGRIAEMLDSPFFELTF